MYFALCWNKITILVIDFCSGYISLKSYFFPYQSGVTHSCPALTLHLFPGTTNKPAPAGVLKSQILCCVTLKGRLYVTLGRIHIYLRCPDVLMPQDPLHIQQ